MFGAKQQSRTRSKATKKRETKDETPCGVRLWCTRDWRGIWPGSTPPVQGRTAFRSSRWTKWPRVSPAAFWRRSISESLRDAVREALPETDLGKLESIKTLPGMVRAAVSTLDKVWRADIDLSSSSHPRLKALAALEENVLRRLPPSMKKPRVLVDWPGDALRMQQRCWDRSKSTATAKCRCAGAHCCLLFRTAFQSPGLPGHDRFQSGWSARTSKSNGPRRIRPPRNSILAQPHSMKCWKRFGGCELYLLKVRRDLKTLRSLPRARPTSTIICSRFRKTQNLPIHFVQGVKAVTTADGQTAAALADVLVKGISQERIRRLLRRLHGTPPIADLPLDWPRILPAHAPLPTVEKARPGIFIHVLLVCRCLRCALI